MRMVGPVSIHLSGPMRAWYISHHTSSYISRSLCITSCSCAGKMPLWQWPYDCWWVHSMDGHGLKGLCVRTYAEVLGMEFPWFAWPSDTGTCYEETARTGWDNAKIDNQAWSSKLFVWLFKWAHVTREIRVWKVLDDTSTHWHTRTRWMGSAEREAGTGH